MGKFHGAARVFALVLVLALVSGLWPWGSLFVVEAKAAGGTISNGTDWENFAKGDDDGAWILGGDIELPTTITTRDNFSGTLDGKGHKITIKNNSRLLTGKTYGGLFEILSGSGKISNVIIVLEGDLRIGNAIDDPNAAYIAGVLVGELRGGTVNRCAVVSANDQARFDVRRKQIAGHSYVGGLVGNTKEDSTGTITECYADINIRFISSDARDEKTSYVGGIVGRMKGTINNCAYRGRLLDANRNAAEGCLVVGGIAGELMKNSTMSYCVVGSYSGYPQIYLNEVAGKSTSGENLVTEGFSAGSYNALVGFRSGSPKGTMSGCYGSVSGPSGAKVIAVTDADIVGASPPGVASLSGSWSDTDSGKHNLAWLVTPKPTVTVTPNHATDGVTTAQLQITPNDNGRAWNFDAQIPVQGQMSTPQGGTISAAPGSASVTIALQSCTPPADGFYSGMKIPFQATVTGLTEGSLTGTTALTWSAKKLGGGDVTIQNGLLEVPADYAGNVTVTAQLPAAYGGATASATVLINPGKVEVSAAAQKGGKGSTIGLAAKLTGGKAFVDAKNSIEWTVAPTSSKVVPKDPKDQAVLTIGATESNASLEVKAALHGRSGKTNISVEGNKITNATPPAVTHVTKADPASISPIVYQSSPATVYTIKLSGNAADAALYRYTLKMGNTAVGPENQAYSAERGIQFTSDDLHDASQMTLSAYTEASTDKTKTRSGTITAILLTNNLPQSNQSVTIPFSGISTGTGVGSKNLSGKYPDPAYGSTTYRLASDGGSADTLLSKMGGGALWSLGSITISNVRPAKTFSSLWPTMFYLSGSGGGGNTGVTAAPIIRPKAAAGEFIDPNTGITIEGAESGEQVMIYYTTATVAGTCTNPVVGQNLYTNPLKFPDNGTYFEVRAIAITTNKSVSTVSMTVYTSKDNLSKPAAPRLLMGEDKETFVASSAYPTGIQVHFSADSRAEVHYTTDGTPATKSSKLYDPSQPWSLSLAQGETAATVRAVAYIEGNDLMSEEASYQIRVSQALGPPEPSIATGSTVAVNQAVTFTLSDAVVRQLYGAGLAVAKFERGGDHIVADSSLAPDKITGEAFEGVTYISWWDNGTGALPDIQLVPEDGPVQDLAFGLRLVKGDSEAGFTVSYTQPGRVVFSGEPGTDVKIKAKTVPADNLFAESGLETFTYHMRGRVATPTSQPATGADSYAEVNMGDGIELLCDTAGAAIVYTTDGTQPQAHFAEGKIVLDSDSTVVYSEPYRILVDDQVLTINAVALHPDLEQSLLATLRFQVAKLPSAVTPTASPVTGNEPTQLVYGEKITLSTKTPGAGIFFTVNGAEPVPSEKALDPASLTLGASGTFLYKDGVPMLALSASPYFTITAVAADTGSRSRYSASEPARLTYRLKRAAAPTATPPSALESAPAISPGTQILLTCATPGARIYYTTDNSAPVAGVSKEYRPGDLVMPSDISAFFMVRAVVRADGYDDSEPVLFAYQLPAPVQAVMADPPGGEVVKGTKVKLSCVTDGAKIYYTTDGGEPEPGEDPAYGSPIQIDEDTAICAIAVKDGMKSSVSEFDFEVSRQLKPPEASVATGSVVNQGTRVTLYAKRGSIAYTLDGSDPKELAEAADKPENDSSSSSGSSSGSSGGVNVTVNTAPQEKEEKSKLYYGTEATLIAEPGETVTLRAYAYQSGYTPSEVATFTYTIGEIEDYLTAVPAPDTPVSVGSKITLATGLTNGRIFYTTGDGTPGVYNVLEDEDEAGGRNNPRRDIVWEAEEGTFEGSVVTVRGEPGGMFTIRATAVADGSQGGSVVVFTYPLNERAAAPTADVPSGAITLSGASVRLSAREGEIFYTTDGTDPTTSSRLYDKPISLSDSIVLKAIAVVDGKDPSEIVEYVYTRAGQVAAPTMSARSGEIVVGTNITLGCSTEGAVIYYTTDASEPGPGSPVYEGPIAVTRSVTIRARAYQSKLDPSPMNMASYTVVEPVAPKVETEEERLARLPIDRLSSRRDFAGGDEGPLYSDVVLIDRTNNVVASSPSGVIPAEAKLVVTRLEPSEADRRAVAGQNGYGIASLYGVSLEVGGEPAEPAGTFELGLPIPEEYRNGIVVVLRVGDDGTAEELPTRRAGGMAYVLTDSLSRYAVAAPHVLAASGGAGAYAALGGAGLLVLAGGAAAVIIRRRRKKAR